MHIHLPLIICIPHRRTNVEHLLRGRLLHPRRTDMQSKPRMSAGLLVSSNTLVLRKPRTRKRRKVDDSDDESEEESDDDAEENDEDDEGGATAPERSPSSSDGEQDGDKKGDEARPGRSARIRAQVSHFPSNSRLAVNLFLLGAH